MNVASGSTSDASGEDGANVAVGSDARASGASSSNVAIGARSRATDDGGNKTAVGADARATGANSSAFGAGAQATRADQQAFGTGTSTYTFAGLTSAASTAAQVGPTQLVTTDAAGNIASDGGRTFNDIAGLRSDVNRAFKEIDKNTEGIAIAMAMGGLALPSDKTFAVSANLGFFDDKQAFAAQGAIRLDRTFTLQGGIGVGLNGGEVGGRVGIQAAW